jgi:ABC-type sugar transport system ATPase subunit
MMKTITGFDHVAAITAEPKTTPLLAVRHVRRSFGETIALDDCSFEIAPGEIHGLVGENGSGKSTLIKILSGVISPDSGQILWDGSAVDLQSPWQSQSLRIGTVFQETLVLDALSIRDNIMLGVDQRIRRKFPVVAEAAKVHEVLAVLGLGRLDVEAPVSSLTLAQRQIVSIARSLARPWRLLILDESTSALDVGDRDRLFEVLRGYRDRNHSILFVSHRMDEIEKLVDRSTVLRSGRSVATLATAEASTERLLELMSPKREVVAEKIDARVHRSHVNVEPVIKIRDLALTQHARASDLDIFPGEIFGVAGLEGHGQQKLLEIVAGLRRAPAGSINSEGHRIATPVEAQRRGISYLPRDRKNEGIFAPLSVADNIMVSNLKRVSRFGILNTQMFRAQSIDLVAQMRVRTAGIDAAISSLSGGNQQKVLLARLIATQPRLLVLNDPMRGVDLGAKRDLYDVLKKAADGGIAVLLLSTELVELCLLCDRVAVFHSQEIVRTIDRADLREETLIEAMFGLGGRGRGHRS